MATVSVVIPNYNHGLYLRKRIDSVLGQTYQDFEVILLDDCSTDNSRDILKPYACDERVRIEFNDQNSGTPFKQWNKGVRMARGKYVWIAESDDYADVCFLERMVPLLAEKSDVTFAYCRSHRIGEDDQLQGYADWYLEPWDAEHWKTDFLVEGYQECRRFFAFLNPVPNASAVLFRKQIYEQVGGADERYKVSADYQVWAKMALRGKIAYVADPMNYFRSHSANVRSHAVENELGATEHFYAMRWIVERLSAPGTWVEKSASDRAPAELPLGERMRACIDSISYIADWNLRFNPQAPRKLLREHLKEWQFALYEREFAVSVPSRWRFFVFKWKFYGHYFPAMTWRLRLINLAKVLGSPLLGYRHRRLAAQLYARALGSMQR